MWKWWRLYKAEKIYNSAIKQELIEKYNEVKQRSLEVKKELEKVQKELNKYK